MANPAPGQYCCRYPLNSGPKSKAQSPQQSPLGTHAFQPYLAIMRFLSQHNSNGGIKRFFQYLIVLVLVCISSTAAGQYVFDFNPRCRQAYEAIVQLRLDAGQQMINHEKLRNPSNLVPYFLENYIDFFVLFFNEDPAEYKARKNNFSRRLDLMNKGPESSPFHLFTRSVMNFQWAAVQIKFGNTWDAGWAFRRSYLQAKDNLNKFPAFSPSRLFHGTLQVSAGTVPDGYKWLSNLMGIRGSIDEGMKLISSFLQQKDEYAKLFHEEGVFYYLYLKFYIENDKDGVFDYIQKQDIDIVNNHLLTFLAANLSINNQQSENAERIIHGRNLSPGYLVTSAWDLELGYSRIQHLETDAAFYLERFIRDFNGRFYLKDALQKLSWHYYLQGNQQKAEEYRAMILKRGALDTEADKQAQKEAQSGKWPNKLLLQVRLLNDGGYHREALRLLHGKTIADFSLPEEKLEFSYRVARLYDDLGNKEDAILFYKEAIAKGEHRKEYFAARAALHIGYIYEQKGDKQNAINWFRRCISMKDHDFKDSLDQRAKAGIERSL